MSENQGVIVQAPHKVAVQDLPYPTLPGEDWLIVRTTAVAINPTDYKHVEAEGEWDTSGLLVGFDYAGVVEDVGPAPARPFKKGDRIAGIAHGTNYYRKSDGAFAKYIAVRSGLQMRIPDNLSDAEAASLGIANNTTGLSLYRDLELPPPTQPAEEPFWFFIYGGSTAMGITAIQFAKLSGARVIATASPANADYVRSLGADHVLDYKSPTVADEIIELAGGKLKYAYDCHGDETSTTICSKVVNGEGGRIATLVITAEEQLRASSSAKIYTPLGYTAFGEDFWIGERWKARPQDYEFTTKFMGIYEDVYAAGKVKPPKIFLNRGGSGLEGVITGLGDLRDGKVSGGKLVYAI